MNDSVLFEGGTLTALIRKNTPSLKKKKGENKTDLFLWRVDYYGIVWRQMEENVA